MYWNPSFEYDVTSADVKFYIKILPLIVSILLDRVPPSKIFVKVYAKCFFCLGVFALFWDS